MLQQKAQNYENEIISMKILASGGQIMEVISKCIGIDNNIIRLLNPQALMSVPGKVGEEPGMAMVNFMLTADPTKIIELNRTQILSIGVARKEASDAYNNIGSNIIKPKSSNLVI